MSDAIRVGADRLRLRQQNVSRAADRRHAGHGADEGLQQRGRQSPCRLAGGQVVSAAKDLLNDPDIDLVVIATPNDTHFPLTKAALEAGKHVVVDKPFTVTLSQARELESLAKHCGRVRRCFITAAGTVTS